MCGFVVEWVRHCFKSKWRLTRDSDRTRDGFYYYSPPGTPHYPGFHNLGSRDWSSDERLPWPALGEWEGSRGKHDGSRPARLPLPLRVGSPDCIANGERPGLPILANRSAACSQILPPNCYAIDDEWLAKTNVLDCVFAKKCADILEKAYTDLGAAEVLIAALVGSDATIRSFPVVGDTFPAICLAIKNDTAILWISGTSNFQQLALQGLYFGFLPVDVGGFSASALYFGAALLISDIMNAEGAGAIGRVVLTGHSYGGALALVLAAIIRRANPNRNVEILTLGAPQPGDERLRDLIADLRQTNYANQSDPIPYQPPRGLSFAGMIPVIGPVLERVWPRFRRPPHTVLITEDGQFVPVNADDLPEDVGNSTALLIGQALAVPQFTAHTCNYYSYYLCNACKCVPRPCREPFQPAIQYDVHLNITIDLGGFIPHTYDFNDVCTAGLLDGWFGFNNVDYFAFFAIRDPNNSVVGLRIQVEPHTSEGFGYILRWSFPGLNWVDGVEITTMPTVDFTGVPGNYVPVVISLNAFTIAVHVPP